MQITLIGAGPGGPGGLTGEGLLALQKADVVFGAPRLLKTLAAFCPGARQDCYLPEPVFKALRAHPEWKAPCVLLSGDVGFYSGAARLRAALQEAGYAVRSIAGVPSVACFAAALGRPWQAWHLVSAHGIACDPAAQLRLHAAVFFLTGGEGGVHRLLQAACDGGLANARAAVGEALSYPEQRVTAGTAAALCGQSFAPLSVLLLEREEDRG